MLCVMSRPSSGCASLHFSFRLTLSRRPRGALRFLLFLLRKLAGTACRNSASIGKQPQPVKADGDVLPSWRTTPIGSGSANPRTEITRKMMTPTSKARFWWITRHASRLTEIAKGMLRRLSLMSTTFPISIATSVPAGTMAKPTDAVARAGASFTPSPTLAADERFVGALLYERMNGPTHPFDGAGLQHARQREEKQQHRALERMIDDRRSSAASTINRSTSMAFSRKDRRPTSTQKSRP
jgi:hypothetical protein